MKRNLKKDKFRLANVRLSDGTVLKLWTKLPLDIGRSVGAYAEKWLASTNLFDAKSLVDFINDKQPGYAFTEEGFEAYRKKVQSELN